MRGRIGERQVNEGKIAGGGGGGGVEGGTYIYIYIYICSSNAASPFYNIDTRTSIKALYAIYI